MLVVISDLHFQEEAASGIVDAGNQRPLSVKHNLPADSFKRFVARLARDVLRSGSNRMDLVLNGDIFDLHRTALWLTDNPERVRPYSSVVEPGGYLEKMVLAILGAISREPEVSQSLEVFQLLGRGRYVDGVEQDFPVPVKIHFIPGNHDRLANGTPALRLAVRDLLGMETDGEEFANILRFPEVGAFIRHGHEYDRFNFALDFSRGGTIPEEIPAQVYREPNFGDWATIDVAVRLPFAFRQFHGDEAILSDEVLRSVYRRLLQFDDLRPQAALLNFLLGSADDSDGRSRLWGAIEPTILKMLDDIADDKFMKEQLKKLNRRLEPDGIDLIIIALRSRLWRQFGLPLGVAKYAASRALEVRGVKNEALDYVSREEAVTSGNYRLLVAGHTHKPCMELLSSDRNGERYYIDTGTWRYRLPATSDFKSFGRTRSLTYLYLNNQGRPGEVDEGGHGLTRVDFWTGVTKEFD